jgi:hypothetical protein
MSLCARIWKLAIASFQIRLADFEPSAKRLRARKSATSGANLSHKNSMNWIFMRELAYLWVLRRAAEGSQICDFREAKVAATSGSNLSHKNSINWIFMRQDRRCKNLRLATGGSLFYFIATGGSLFYFIATGGSLFYFIATGGCYFFFIILTDDTRIERVHGRTKTYWLTTCLIVTKFILGLKMVGYWLYSPGRIKRQLAAPLVPCQVADLCTSCLVA